MLMMLAAPFLLLTAVVLPTPLSRLAGVVVIAILVGLTWRAAMIGSVDVMMLMGGAMLARRFGFPGPVSMIWARRVAKTVCGIVALEFGVFALLLASYTGNAVSALPFALGMLLSGLALAKLMRRRQEGLAGNGTASLVPASPQAACA